MTRIGRHDTDFETLLAEAVRAALHDADPSAIDAVFLSSFASRELCGLSDARTALAPVMRELGIAPSTPVHGPFLTGGDALHRAVEHCHAKGRDVLVAGCEKMTHVDAATASGL